MNPEIRNFAELERFIKEHPEETDAIEEAYFYLRDQHEDEQMQTQGEIDPLKVPVEFLAQTALALAFRNRPKIIEDDRDYQKLVEKHQKLWLEKNKGKDFTSKEGIDYLYGKTNLDVLKTGAEEDLLAEEGWERQWAKSVGTDLPKNKTLSEDAEQEFRSNPKFKKRIDRYDKEKKKIYKNPKNDPAITMLGNKMEMHSQALQKHLKTISPQTPIDTEEIDNIVQKQSWKRFAAEHPEKTKAYAQKNADIKKALEKHEIAIEYASPKAEPIAPTPLRPVLAEHPTSIPQTERFFDRGGRRISSIGRQFGTQGGRFTSGIGRQGTRLVARAGMAAGRAAVGALMSNPMGWIAIGVVVVIIIAVFIIIMLEGGGGGGLFQKGIAKLEGCLDENGNAIVTNGNDCATNLASYYSNEENAEVTARCVDKCSNLARTVSCDRAGPLNTECDIPLYNSCGGDKVFCILYTPDAPALNRLYDCNASTFEGYQGNPALNSCNQTDAPTPTPTLTPIP